MIRIPAKVITHAPELAPPPPEGVELPPGMVAMTKRSKKVKFLPSTWAELHQRALAYEGKNDLRWLVFFSLRIGGKCECRKNWRTELQALPPDFLNYFRWSVGIHNLVNVRLGKPQVTLDEAKKIWATPSPADPDSPGPAPLDLKM